MPKQPTFSDDRPGWHKRWGAEFKAAKEALGPWHKEAEEAIKQYRNDSAGKDPKLRLWSGHVNLREAIMYGKTPKVDVTRRYNDAEDHVGRVAAQILNRLLNGDIERDEETYPRTLGSVLKDWLMVSFGNGRMRYVREAEPVEAIPPILDDDGTEKAPGVPATEKVTHEDVETDYSHWKHQLWSPSNVFSEVRWHSFRTLVSSETSKKKFGVRLPMKVQAGSDRESEDKDQPSPLDRSVVWEIWDKEHGGVWWYCEDHKEMLVPKDIKSKVRDNGMLPDPLGLRGFWPFPEPLTSNMETSKYVPQTDYSLAKDQFESINVSTGGIALLKDAIKVRGVYDKTVGELQGLLDSRGGNKMIPAQNYAALSEKGGIAACVAWLPLEAIVAALDKLRELRREEMELLIQITGDSDIVRGQAMSTGVTATEQSLKAKFASIPMQKAQIDFARYASQAQSIRGEIISKHFDPETIALRANVQGLPQIDQQYVDQAIQLLKSDFYRFRVVVKPEAISLTDYAQNKQEAMDILGTIGAYGQAMMPMMQMAPPLAPAIIQLLQKFIAKTKGGEDTEGILDQAIEMAKQMAAQPPQPPAPDPTAMVKAQAEVGKAHATIAKTGMDMQRDQMKFGMDVAKMHMEGQRSAQEHAQGIQSEEAQARADILKTVSGITSGGVPS